MYSFILAAALLGEFGAPIPIVDPPITAVDRIPQPDASTPLKQVVKILDSIRPNREEVLYDLGCGDARVCILAAKLYGCRGVGIENDTRKVKLARLAIEKNRVDHLVEIRYGDARKEDISQASIVYVYLTEELLKELVPRFKAKRNKGMLVISYIHKLPNCVGQQEGDFYLYWF